MKYTVNVGGNTYHVEINDLTQRPVLAVIGEETFEVWPESNQARAAVAAENPKAPLVQPLLNKISAVKAPIPGVITAILVKQGDTVSPGQELCKLEAMKMNNSIRANRGAKIEAINISVGQQVKHGDLLFEFAE